MSIFIFLILFVNLHNSFKFVTKTSNKIYMRCDYYIEQKLYIHYNDNSFSFIKLHRDRGYYHENYDKFLMNITDEDTQASKWEKFKKYHLEPIAIPFVIFSNNNFIDIHLVNTYKEIIETKMINKKWDNVKQIEIVEERHERE